MVHYCKFITLFLIFILPVNSSADKSKVDDENTTYVENLQLQRFCKQSAICSSVNTDLSEYGDLHFPNCRCDEQCSQYGDCCGYSKISNSKSNFTCVSAAQDDNFYMKTSCPITWRGSSNIISYCENYESIAGKLDIPLFIPVTSENNITYPNLFCALCNEEEIFEFWNVGIWVASNSSLNNYTIIMTLVPDHIDTISIKGKIPPHLVDRVRQCPPNVIDSCPPSWNGTKNCPKYTFYAYHGNKTFKNIECLLCNEKNLTLTNDICTRSKIQTPNIYVISLDDTEELFPELNKFCSEIPQQIPAFKVLCPANTIVEEIRDCSSPKDCEIDQIFDINDENIELIGNDTIFLKSFNLELKYDPEETPQWIYTNENKTEIYVCGLNITTNKLLNYISSWLSDILIKLSIICLILHLVSVQQLPALRNTPGKSLAAYSFSLLIAFLCLDMDEKWKLCKYTAVILHYTLLSCFTWMLLMSHNCWLATYRATTKLRQTSDKKSKKFIWYSLIALLIPLLIVSVGVYLEKAPIKQVPCGWKPAYGTGGECFIGGREAFLVLFIIPSSVLFVINNLFFAHTAYLIYFNQRRNTVTQQDQINFKLYIRLALIMGSTWIFGTIYTFSEWSIMQILFIVLNMSQGIFIFVAFTLQKKNLKMLRRKYEKNRKIAAVFTWCLGENTVPNDTTTESLKLNNSKSM